MAAILMLEEIIQEERKRRRQYLPQNFQLANIPDVEFINNYRLTWDIFQNLCEELIPLMPQRVRLSGVDPRIKLHYSPITAGKMVIACCVLHNICNHAGLEAPTLNEEDLQLERSRQADNLISAHQALQQGQRARNSLVQLLDRNRSQ